MTYPSSSRLLEECEAIYETLPGWKQSTADIRNYENLPENAKRYTKFIADFLNTPVALISVGKERTQTIVCNKELL